METFFQKAWIEIKLALIWFAGFFEDQRGGGSSKRAFLYILTPIWYGLAKNPNIDPNFLWAFLLLTLFSLGAITSEWFKDFKLPFLNNETNIK